MTIIEILSCDCHVTVIAVAPCMCPAGHSPHTNMIDPYYVCVSQHSDVIVTDFAEPNVKLLRMSGERREGGKELNYGEYGVASRQGLLQPYGCCQDEYGITMIADNRNDKVCHVLFVMHLM